ncbi:hypothetical protein CVT26_013340 [Gymnopilus dilepis]|uniref:Uncharacterized protein n=1 Tax=Gymnopilus dilepis TaxID=231916 RepID=A0A409YF36_9AGAR|nr:hypothetical protein CVT26_013340 [Gymnopilus dilepis]
MNMNRRHADGNDGDDYSEGDYSEDAYLEEEEEYLKYEDDDCSESHLSVLPPSTAQAINLPHPYEPDASSPAELTNIVIVRSSLDRAYGQHSEPVP